MKLRYILLIATTCLSLGTFAHGGEDAWAKWAPSDKAGQSGVIARAGYTIGGTSPMPLPAEIRHINEFSPKGGANIGIDAYHMFSKRWGVQAGLHFFYQGFHTSADVKNYRMKLVMGGEEMGGYFTGCDVTNTDMWGLSYSLLATFRISPRWNVSAGPFLANYFKSDFSGEVYENREGAGYLRVFEGDEPTWKKVNMSRENPATYDFSENMRPWNGGLEVVFDWKAMKHLNVFGMLDWGMANVFYSDFKETIPFKMFPIYATFGAAYRY